jgi:type VI secretion system secreted protein Hcp
MAVDGYMYFKNYDQNDGGKFLPSESTVSIDDNKEPLVNSASFKFKDAAKAVDKSKGQNSSLFEVEDFSFDIEQTLNIGSQSTGAGAGKVTFNPFSITRKIDISSPTLFNYACSGTAFKEVVLGLRKSAGGTQGGGIYLVFRFKLVAVKTISWSYDDESPKETITFDYGGLQMHYSPQEANGTLKASLPGGWNRVKNIRDLADEAIT